MMVTRNSENNYGTTWDSFFLANFRAKKQVKLTAVPQNKIGGCLTEDTKY